jgi:hypothetical protein
MIDQELLVYERQHHDDPDMTLAKATETQRLALQFWASGGRQQEGGPGDRGRGAASPASEVVSVRLRCP